MLIRAPINQFDHICIEEAKRYWKPIPALASIATSNIFPTAEDINSSWCEDVKLELMRHVVGQRPLNLSWPGRPLSKNAYKKLPGFRSTWFH